MGLEGFFMLFYMTNACMYLSISISIHVYICVYMYIYAHIIYTNIHICVYVLFIDVYINTIYAYIYKDIYTYIYTKYRLYINICKIYIVYISLFIYVHLGLVCFSNSLIQIYLIYNKLH